MKDTNDGLSALLEQVHWNEQGLVPAIAQDYQSGEVLMLAWMNRQALELTLHEKRAVYWSRSRNALWRKGESSGHTQRLEELRLDCDADTILVKVEQLGGIACHTGRRSCFYLRHNDSSWEITDEVIKTPEAIYGSPE
ncbi:MAG: phosphoribosyl-AMP cyclohydrolase [Halioglobus sp.]